MSQMLELIRAGGKTMIFLFLTSFVSLGYIIEKFFSLYFEKKKLAVYKKYLEAPSMKWEEFSGKLRKDDSTTAVVLRNVLENRSMSREENTEITHAILRHEISSLEKGIEVIEIAASVSPLLGLLGTVIGLLEIFSVIAKKGVGGDPSDLSGGIAKALITTVVGLIIAIPSYAAHAYFSKKIEDLVVEIDKYVVILISKIYGTGKDV
jgi:biopolymer transport protein ExbB